MSDETGQKYLAFINQHTDMQKNKKYTSAISHNVCKALFFISKEYVIMKPFVIIIITLIIINKLL